MKKNINQISDYNKKIIFLLVGFSLAVRLISSYFFHDNQLEYEWKNLVHNLITYKVYSYFDPSIPSAMMPPLYAYFLYCIKILTFERVDFLNTVIFVQVILSTISVFIFYKISRKFFSYKTCLIVSYIFSLFPLNFYSVGQISAITIQIFLTLLFLLFVFNLAEQQTKKNILIFSLISAILLLTRGEFILIYAITLFYFLIKNKVKIINLVIIIFLTFLVLSPYLIRNYVNFNKIIIVKSFGINLWKGNNELSSVEGYYNLSHPQFKNLKVKIDSLNKDRFYELNRDKIFLNQAIKNLNKDPLNYLSLFFKKALSFYFIDLNSTYPNYYNIYHIMPVAILGILSLPGLILLVRKKEFKINYIKMYFYSIIIIFSIFFILPRYKLIILPIQIMFVGYLIEYIFEKLKKNVI